MRAGDSETEVSSKVPTIGVVAICKNEENDLPAFISHLLPWVDEVIIVDDGSTDASLDIIRSSGGKVHLVERAMDSESGFSGLRNIGIEKASSDWLLHTDVDERISPQLVEEIKLKIKDTQFNGFKYRRLNFFLHRAMKGAGFQDWCKPQLARRGEHRFKNRVHEVCEIEGGSACVGVLDAFIWHLNDESYQERMEKSVVYCQEQARRLERRKFKVYWWHFVVLPGLEFGRKYLWKKGFRDGTHGLLFSIHASCAMFKACALVWDKQNQLPRTAIEQEITRLWASAGSKIDHH